MPYFIMKAGDEMVFGRTIVLMIIGLLLITAGGVLAQDQEPTPLPTPTPASSDCYSCHLDVAVTWQFSPHALAYSNELFQSTWFNQRSNPTCLACHTTGFVPRTQTYHQEGVTCVACHGDTPADHPPQSVNTIGSEVCADCHTTTYGEWERGPHSLADMTCTTCHDPHNAKLLAQDAQALCLSCHETVEQTYSHVIHQEQACVDCHYHAKRDINEHFVSGNLLPSGHQVDVFAVACIECHADTADTQFVAQRVSTLTEPREPEPFLSLIQGVLLGGGFGVTLTAFLIQARRRDKNKK